VVMMDEESRTMGSVMRLNTVESEVQVLNADRQRRSAG